MKQLIALKVQDFYRVDTPRNTMVYRTPEELLKDYNKNLLDILNEKWYYSSPQQPDNQLYLFNPDDEGNTR